MSPRPDYRDQVVCSKCAERDGEYFPLPASQLMSPPYDREAFHRVVHEAVIAASENGLVHTWQVTTAILARLNGESSAMNCDTIMVGIDPDTGETCQLIGTACVAAPDGVKVHVTDNGDRYWCRPFEVPSTQPTAWARS